ncbi:hypothetical protein [Yokenella regensburgei]|jgi:hypothetical protein|uniref:hypothetical protein n=1 Tax=Yokenella regensburgei TaxID=158877 RepID=UPI003EDA6E34
MMLWADKNAHQHNINISNVRIGVMCLPEGKNADLVLLDTTAVSDVILDLPARRVVMKRGKVVATSEYLRTLAF